MKNKLLSILFLFVLAFGCVNAVSFEYVQSDVINQYAIDEHGNTKYESFLGHNDYVFTADNSSENITYDYYLEYPEFVNKLYIKVQVGRSGNITIMYRSALNVDSTLYINPFNLNQSGIYWFSFEPTENNEILKIYFNLEEDLNVAQIETTEIKPYGFAYYIKELFSIFMEVLNFNLLAWQVLFWIFILIFLTLFTSMLFTLAIWIFQYLRDLKRAKKEFNREDDF